MKIKKVVLIVILLVVIIIAISLSVSNLFNQGNSENNLPRNDFNMVTNNNGSWPVGSMKNGGNPENDKREVKENLYFQTDKESQNKLIVNKKTENLYNVELNIQDYQLWNQNYPRLIDLNLTADGSQNNLTNIDEKDIRKFDQSFSLKKNINDRVKGAGVYWNYLGCDPVLQKIVLFLRLQNNEKISVSNEMIENSEQFTDKEIEHQDYPKTYDLPEDPIAKSSWCSNYKTLKEKPEKTLETYEKECEYTYCAREVTINPFKFNPSMGTLTINKKISFDLTFTQP